MKAREYDMGNCRTMLLCRSPCGPSLFAVLVLVLASGVGFPEIAFGDAIVQVNGRRLEDLEIVTAHWDSVEYTISGQRRTLHGDRVESLERDSDFLREARRRYESGDYSGARREYVKAAQRSRYDWEKAEAAYYVGECYLREGDPKKARAAFEKYVSAHREGKDWWVPHAIRGIGQAALDGRDGNGARKQFSGLAAFGGNWKVRSLIGIGYAHIAAGDPIEARKVFSQVSKMRSAPLSLRQEAAAGRAEVLFAQKQYTNVIKDLESTFFKPSRNGDVIYSRSRARATLLTGRAYAAQEGKKNLELAEIWLLKVTALYRKYPKEYGEAAKHLVTLYGKLGREDRARDWRRRLKKSGSKKSGKNSGKKNGNKQSRS